MKYIHTVAAVLILMFCFFSDSVLSHPFTENLFASTTYNGETDALYFYKSSPSLTGGSISGTVYYDSNKNSMRDIGEPGVANKTIYCSGPDEYETTTDTNGNYTITGIEPEGWYAVSLAPEDGWVHVEPLPTGKHHLFVGESTPTHDDINFGTYYLPVRIKNKIIITDAQGNTTKSTDWELSFGVRAGASSFIDLTPIDHIEGEMELPPAAPSSFDNRFYSLQPIDSVPDSPVDMRDYISATQIDTYRVKFQTPYFPITITWDKYSIQNSYSGVVKIMAFDPDGERNHQLNMKNDDSLVLDYRYQSFKIIAEGPNAEIQSTYSAAWKISSASNVLSDWSSDAVFPTGVSKPFSFVPGLGYQENDLVVSGLGYFVKHREDVNLPPPIDPPILVDTISLGEGWNLVGSPGVELAVSNIITEPADIIQSPFYKFHKGYHTTETLEPRNGYWVKSNQNGILIMNTLLSSSLPAGVDKVTGLPELEEFNNITITDALDNVQILYFTDNDELGRKINLRKFELPPAPPQELFDVRFKSNHNVAVFNPGQKENVSILLASAAYPVTMTWNVNSGQKNASLKVDSKNISLSGIGSTQIEKPAESIVLTSDRSALMPSRFSLEQNYPNPFNPVTKIGYRLPENSFVTLKVFNVIGQEVAVLVNELQEAGVKTVEWQTPNVPSGVYVYRLQAGTFSETRKMILMK